MIMVLDIHVGKIVQQVPVPLEQALNEIKDGDNLDLAHVDDLV